MVMEKMIRDSRMTNSGHAIIFFVQPGEGSSGFTFNRSTQTNTNLKMSDEKLKSRKAITEE